MERKSPAEPDHLSRLIGVSGKRRPHTRNPCRCTERKRRRGRSFGKEFLTQHIYCTSLFCSFNRKMLKVITVTPVVGVSTPWSIETHSAACRARVTSAALCPALCVTCGLDNARAERGWKEHSAATVHTTTTTAVRISRVRRYSETFKISFPLESSNVYKA